MYENERFLPPYQAANLPAQTLGEWILTHASQQGTWSLSRHRELLDLVSQCVSDAADALLSLELPTDAPADGEFSVPPGITLSCATELAPFEHAVELDCEPDVAPDPALLARARQLCGQCSVRSACLNYGVSSPELESGLFGGQTKEERRPVWQKHHEERLARLTRAYEPVQKAWAGYMDKTENEAEIGKALTSLRKQFTIEPVDIIPRQLAPDIKGLLLNPTIVDRVSLLLSPKAATILRHWAAAIQESGDNPFEYGDKNVPQSRLGLQDAEATVEATLRELGEGDFDYKAWYYRTRVHVHNPLSFLLNLGLPIPDGNTEVIKQVGRDTLAMLPALSKRAKYKENAAEIIGLYFGLGDEPLSFDQIIARFDSLNRTSLGDIIRYCMRKLRAELRVQNNNGEEQA